MPRSSSIDEPAGASRPPSRSEGPTPSEAQRGVLCAALARHLAEVPPGLPDGQAPALLPVLHELQDAIGHVPPALVPEIAAALNLSRAEVHGVVTYYHHFRTAPAGRHVVQICQAEACRANGAVELMAQAADRLRCAPGTTRADCGVTLEPVYCLGLCATGPAAMVDEQPRARVTADTVSAWAARFDEDA